MTVTRKRLVIVGVLVFVIGLVVLFPARVAYQWFGAGLFEVAGLNGTVWRGEADAVETSGVAISDVRWTMQPLQLLLGRAAFDLEGDLANGSVAGNVQLGFTGNIAAKDVQAFIPLDSLQSALRLPGLQGSGSARFEEIRISGNTLESAIGSVEVANLVSPLLGRAPIGGYRLEFQPTDDGVVASVEDTDGVLDVAGSLTVDSTWAYSLLAMVTAKAEASDELKSQLRQLGPANDRGQREVRIEGRL